MHIRGMFVIAAVVLAGSMGCVKSGSVAEKQPVASLAAYKTASIIVEVPTDMKNADQHKLGFNNAIAQRLKEKKIFTDVTPDGGDVSIKVKVTKVDGGSEAMRALGNANSGASEVSASVELLEKGTKPVGAFDVTGNSKKNVQTSVGGINTAGMEDATNKALEAAADEIVAFLEKKR